MRKPNWLQAPTPYENAAKELVQAQHAKLAAETAMEYAASIVEYNEKRIARLTAYIKEGVL